MLRLHCKPLADHLGIAFTVCKSYTNYYYASTIPHSGLQMIMGAMEVQTLFNKPSWQGGWGGGGRRLYNVVYNANLI